MKLNDNRNSIGESQIAAYGNNIYVVWCRNPDEKVVGEMFFVKSLMVEIVFPRVNRLMKKIH